jgi:hypothetical protein
MRARGYASKRLDCPLGQDRVPYCPPKPPSTTKRKMAEPFLSDSIRSPRQKASFLPAVNKNSKCVSADLSLNSLTNKTNLASYLLGSRQQKRANSLRQLFFELSLTYILSASVV